MLKRITKNLALSYGYEIKRIDLKKKLAPKFPVEFDNADIEIASRILDNRLTMVSPQRLSATIMACKHAVAHKLPGAFVECGVWRGGVSLAAKQTFERFGADTPVYLFDTFAGMTEPQAVDKSLWGQSAIDKHREHAEESHNRWAYSSKAEVEKNFTDAAVNMEQVKMVEGDVLQTLDCDELLPSQISVLRLDTDWYESTLKELEVLYPRLCTGGVLLIDDYSEWEGARAAFDEYFADQSSRPFTIATDQSGRACVKMNG